MGGLVAEGVAPGFLFSMPSLTVQVGVSKMTHAKFLSVSSSNLFITLPSSLRGINSQGLPGQPATPPHSELTPHIPEAWGKQPSPAAASTVPTFSS